MFRRRLRQGDQIICMLHQHARAMDARVAHASVSNQFLSEMMMMIQLPPGFALGEAGHSRPKGKTRVEALDGRAV